MGWKGFGPQKASPRGRVAAPCGCARSPCPVLAWPAESPGHVSSAGTSPRERGSRLDATSPYLHFLRQETNGFRLYIYDQTAVYISRSALRYKKQQQE